MVRVLGISKKAQIIRIETNRSFISWNLIEREISAAKRLSLILVRLTNMKK